MVLNTWPDWTVDVAIQPPGSGFAVRSIGISPGAPEGNPCETGTPLFPQNGFGEAVFSEPLGHGAHLASRRPVPDPLQENTDVRELFRHLGDLAHEAKAVRFHEITPATEARGHLQQPGFSLPVDHGRVEPDLRSSPAQQW